MTGIELIADERARQMGSEGWTAEHDAEHTNGSLALAAACYAAPEPIFVHRHAEFSYFTGNTGDRGDRQVRPSGFYDPWPWDDEWDKRSEHDRVRQLAIAGALIAAELDRLLNGGGAL